MGITTLRKRSNRWLKKILAKKKFDVVLNLGCGDDTDSQGNVYKDYIKCNKMIKIDTDAKFVDIVDFIDKAENLPIEDKSVDLVFINWVFHLTDMPVALSEICRVLKGDGEIVISYADHGPIPQKCRDKVAEIRTLLESRFTIKRCFEKESLKIKGNGFQRAEILYGKIKCKK